MYCKRAELSNMYYSFKTFQNLGAVHYWRHYGGGEGGSLLKRDVTTCRLLNVILCQ